jgi:hypothetical protein
VSKSSHGDPDQVVESLTDFLRLAYINPMAYLSPSGDVWRPPYGRLRHDSVNGKG